MRGLLKTITANHAYLIQFPYYPIRFSRPSLLELIMTAVNADPFGPLHSTQNPRVKAAARLRHRRGRLQQDRIIIDGVREISRALDADLQIVEVYYCSNSTGPHSSGPHSSGQSQLNTVLNRTAARGVRNIEVSAEVFGKIAFGQRCAGVVAVAKTPRRHLDDLPTAADSLVAVLEEVEKPGNAGAVIRAADAAGLSGVVVVGGVELFNPNVIRASLGAVFTFPVVAAGVEPARDWLLSRGQKIFAARPNGAVDYLQADFTGGAAIVLGSEANGLSSHWLDDKTIGVRLPMKGAVDSLNVSAAAAVLFYEAQRQRQLATFHPR